MTRACFADCLPALRQRLGCRTFQKGLSAKAIKQSQFTTGRATKPLLKPSCRIRSASRSKTTLRGQPRAGSRRGSRGQRLHRSSGRSSRTRPARACSIICRNFSRLAPASELLSQATSSRIRAASSSCSAAGKSEAASNAFPSSLVTSQLYALLSGDSGWSYSRTWLPNLTC